MLSPIIPLFVAAFPADRMVSAAQDQMALSPVV